MRNSNVYWYVDGGKNGLNKLKKCVKDSREGKEGLIKFFKEDGKLHDYGLYYNEENLFETKEEAEDRVNSLKKLYEGFKLRPFVDESVLRKYLNEFKYVESEIEKYLQDYENFKGIDFCDVNAGGIQIRGHHKQVSGYTYGDQITITYDFTNYQECIKEFVEMWEEKDTKEKLKGYKRFLRGGEQNGWN